MGSLRFNKILCLTTLLISLTFCQGPEQKLPGNNQPPVYPADPIFENPALSDPSYPDLGIFISPSGNDISGSGSMEAPYRTIGHVLSNVAQDSDTLILRGGTYNEAIRIRRPGITIRSKSDEWAVIQTPTNNPEIDTTVIFDVDSSGSKLQRVEIIGGYYYGIMFFTRWDWGGADRSGASHILLEKIRVHHTGRDAIKITPGCDHITIRKSEISHSGIRYSDNAEGIDNVNGDFFLLQDSYIHDIATNGVYCKGGAMYCVIERTRVKTTGGAGILLGFDTSPEFFDLTVNPDYYENINGLVRNCIVENTQGSGIGFYAALNAKVYNNTLINTARSFHAPLYFGLTYQDWEPSALRPPSLNPRIKNNLIYQPSGASPTRNFLFIRYSTDLGGMSALTGMPVMDHNVYYHEDAQAGSFEDRRPGILFSGPLDGWKTHSSQEDNSFAADPMLDATGHLSVESTCRDKGETLSEVSYDFDGEPRGGIYDIGADEI